jgi:DNA-binding SARP family transcriptional activator
MQDIAADWPIQNQEDSVLPPYYRIEMFGGLCLIADGSATVRFYFEPAEALLAFITYRPEVRCRRVDICRALWANLAPGEATSRLNAAIAALRTYLEPAPIAPGRVLRLEGDQVFLAPGAFETDVAELRAALAQTGPSYPEQTRRQALSRAMLLYTGELLAGMKSPWVTEERERWGIIHAAVKYEWEKLPPLVLPTECVVTALVAPQRDVAPRPPFRPMSAPRHYVRSGGLRADE